MEQKVYERLLGKYEKILEVNLKKDTYSIIKYDDKTEKDLVLKSDRISEWLSLFAKSGNVYSEDVAAFKKYTSLSYMRKTFEKHDSHWVQYRRRLGNKYSWAEMEMVKTESYSEENPVIYLTVRQMNEVVNKDQKQGIFKRGNKILLIDANKSDREYLVSELMPEYSVVEMEDSSNAFDYLAEEYQNITAIICTNKWPEINGIKFLVNVRKITKYDSIPILMSIDSISQDLELEFLQKGASDIVLKPYNAEIIKNRIKSTVQLKNSVAMLNVVETDPLTGLYTKQFFFRKVEEIMDTHPDKEYRFICTDIEGFRAINENYGEDVGDAVLIYFAERLTEMIPDILLGGRMSGDVFVFLRENIPFEYDYELWKNLRNKAPIPNIVIKYGMCTIDKNQTVQMAFDHARMAVKSIKTLYNKPFAEYDEQMRQDMLRKQNILDHMERALEEKQFQVYYQPKYNIENEKICGAEALIRWIHPELGFLSPAEFIPLFEKNGFISKVDEYVRNQVCKDVKNWIEKGYKMIHVSVNLSRRDFDDENLAESIVEMVKSYGLDPKYLHFEITESAVADNLEAISTIINKLRGNGFRIELDDFGSGYSSLTTFNAIELDVLKIDRSVLFENKSNEENRVLQFCLQLAKNLGLKTIVEGVETEEQCSELKKMGFDGIQGYYYSKPLSEKEFEEFSFAKK